MTFVRSVIDYFSRAYGYKIFELENFQGIIGTWGIFKTTLSSTELIIFTENTNREKVDKKLLESEVKRVLQCSSLTIIEVIICEEEIFQGVNLDNTIVVNLRKNQINYQPESIQSTVVLIAQFLNENHTQQANNKTSISIATNVIMGINVMAYILTAFLSGNLFNSDINVLVMLGAKVNSLILQGEYYRLFTCMFLHGGIMHLGLNMYGLYALGNLMENIYGVKAYLITYFSAGILASIFSFLFSDSISIGASGAIFGLLGAALVYGYKMRKHIGKEFVLNIASVILVNLFIGFSIANIDNFAHIGGLIGGVVISSIMIYIMKKFNKINN